MKTQNQIVAECTYAALLTSGVITDWDQILMHMVVTLTPDEVIEYAHNFDECVKFINIHLEKEFPIGFEETARIVLKDVGYGNSKNFH